MQEVARLSSKHSANREFDVKGHFLDAAVLSFDDTAHLKVVVAALIRQGANINTVGVNDGIVNKLIDGVNTAFCGATEKADAVGAITSEKGVNETTACVLNERPEGLEQREEHTALTARHTGNIVEHGLDGHSGGHAGVNTQLHQR